MNKSKILLDKKGYTTIPNFFDEVFVDEVGLALNNSYELCRKIQIENGIDISTDGTVHHLLANGDIYLLIIKKICSSALYDFIKEYFEGNFIINSYGGVINLTGRPSYVSKVHRDIRFFSGDFPLMLNLLIMLDDFTLENGATYVLAKSHKLSKKPSDEEFYAKANRVVGKKGDLLFFNSNLWHAAGINKTSTQRRAITITFTKPFMKQQLDYPRAIGYKHLETLSEELQQVIGYFARTPINLNEWYQPPNKRFYRPGQD